MSGSVNKVTILGRVGRDPEVKSFANGGKIATFSVATSERWTDKQSGEKKERTEWHNVVVQGEGLVRVVDNYLRKGSKVYLEGKLQTRKWQDKDGQDRYQTEVVVNGMGGGITLLDAPGGDREDKPRREPEPKRSFADDLEDQIPF